MFAYTRSWLLLSLILSFIFTNILADECDRYQTCGKCIRHPQCGWCSQKNFTNVKRCFNVEDSDNDRPNCNNVTNPRGSVSTKEGILGSSYDGRQNSEFAEGEVPHLIQITPLVVNLTLRPNLQQTIRVAFQLSKDYPLDVYYLTDSSWSMSDDIKKVAALSNKISLTMRSITNNFRLGCGTFVDKPLRPFGYYFEGCERQEGVCSAYENNGITKKYEYQHLLPLKANSTMFQGKMESIVVQGNQDDLEGGLSALMQVLMCKNAIGWRDNSNRLLIFSSDSDYHQAGDGKFAGIVTPNDGQCHLDEDGFYTHSALLDYPSISHINYMTSKQNTMIIFAITNQSTFKSYEELSKGIKGSVFADLSDSNNIVELLKNEYKKVISSVELNDTSSNLIDVKYRANCSNGAIAVDSHRCTNLTIGNRVYFDVTFKLKKCPPDGESRSETFEIRPSGMNESVIVNVDMICDCQCEKEDVSNKSSECNGAGSYRCGICDCDDDHTGWNCECHKDKQYDNLSSKCVPPTNGSYSSALECSGNGICVCGKCRCYDAEHISGTYCDCDDRSCRQKDNKICNGHGICNCGECECDNEWTHSSPDEPVCDCILLHDSCFFSPSSEDVCSGYGECVCGKCICQEGFVGDHCQVPPRNLELCKQMEDCVECLAFGTGPKFEPKKTNNCSNCSSFELSLGIKEKNEDAIQCYSKDVNGCSYQFVYYYEDMQLRICAQEEKPECEKIDVLMYISSTTGVGLIVGLLSLIAWKIVTMTYDRMEYNKFLKEQERAKWNSAGNPLYVAPTITIQNPMFELDS